MRRPPQSFPQLTRCPSMLTVTENGYFLSALSLWLKQASTRHSANNRTLKEPPGFRVVLQATGTVLGLPLWVVSLFTENICMKVAAEEQRIKDAGGTENWPLWKREVATANDLCQELLSNPLMPVNPTPESINKEEGEGTRV